MCTLRELASAAETLKAEYGKEAEGAGLPQDAWAHSTASNPPPGLSPLHMRVSDFDVLVERLRLAMALVAGLIQRHASKYSWMTLLRACGAHRVQKEEQEKASGEEPSLEPVGDSRSRDVAMLLPHENYGHLVAEMSAGSAFGELAITSETHRERTATVSVSSWTLFPVTPHPNHPRLVRGRSWWRRRWRAPSSGWWTRSSTTRPCAPTTGSK